MNITNPDHKNLYARAESNRRAMHRNRRRKTRWLAFWLCAALLFLASAIYGNPERFYSAVGVLGRFLFHH